MTATALPIAPRRPRSQTLQDRVVALLILLPSAGVLILASCLDASPTGTGTHTQLGLSQCGMLLTTGLPCATCGMTTSFTHAAHGRLLTAAAVQPAGALLAVLTAALVVVTAYAAVTGASLAPLGRALWRPRFVLILLGIVVLAWGYTIGRTLGA